MVELQTLEEYDPGEPERFHMLVTREEWGALPPSFVTPLPLPVTNVRYIFTATSECFSPEQCVEEVRYLQKKHQDTGVPDIAYNFLIGGDNRVYEGRGWDAESEIPQKYEKHLKGKTIDIAFIGIRYFDESYKVPFDQMDLARGIINWGVDHKKIKVPYTVDEYYNEKEETWVKYEPEELHDVFEYMKGEYRAKYMYEKDKKDKLDKSVAGLMRAAVQKVSSASVTVDHDVIASIGPGLCVLIGISKDDTVKDISYIADKVLALRLFHGETTRWSQTVMDLSYEVLCLSNITLYHNHLSGNKMDFHKAMKPENSRPFFQRFLEVLRDKYSPEKVKAGKFAVKSSVNIVNDGPNIVFIESPLNKAK